MLDMVIKLSWIKLRGTFSSVLEFAPRYCICLRLCFSFCCFKLQSSTKDDTKERPTWPNHTLSYGVCKYFWQNWVCVAMDHVLERNKQRNHSRRLSLLQNKNQIRHYPVQNCAWLHAWLKVTVMFPWFYSSPTQKCSKALIGQCVHAVFLKIYQYLKKRVQKEKKK